MKIVGYTHYHPYSRDTSLSFTNADRELAEEYSMAAHLTNSNGDTNEYYRYLTPEKRKWVFGGN